VLDERIRGFLEKHHGAVMATLKRDGSPHVARIGVALMGDVLWSSGTRGRVRTEHVRREPRATLCVLDDSNPWAWMGVESHVRILDGADAPQRNLELYRKLAGEPKDVEEYLGAMVAEGRLIFEFSIDRTYGQY
jgi:PPOX class probable F420-dependent enzyme